MRAHDSPLTTHDPRPTTHDPRPSTQQTAAGCTVYSLLALVVVLYLIVALAYAAATPTWQAPDEPAHFNYVKYLAERRELPVLQPGDYPTAVVPLGPDRRPADVSAFRYESHQPPLFYALGAIVYSLHPSVMALRMLSILFGAALLLVAFFCARLMLPWQPWLWLATAAFVAFIPMHLFVAGSVENDTLADLVLSLLLLTYLAIAAGGRQSGQWLWLGFLAGVAVLTKVTIYLPAALLVIASCLLILRGNGNLINFLKAVATVVLVAAAVSGWWLVRNGLTYGWSDVLVQAHQAEVAGSQVQTSAFGLAELLRFLRTSFNSFWGQFGWMSIPLPQRDYAALLSLTALACLGWLATKWQALAALHKAGRVQLPAGSPLNKLALADVLAVPFRLWLGLGVTFAGVVAGDLIYNLRFVQPQGRYLFPALVPIAMFYVCGVMAFVPRRLVPLASGLLSLTMLVFAVHVLQRNLIPAFYG